jgi:hypothetical protein
VGIEPTTYCAKSNCSTIELSNLVREVRLQWVHTLLAYAMPHSSCRSPVGYYAVLFDTGLRPAPRTLHTALAYRLGPPCANPLAFDSSRLVCSNHGTSTVVCVPRFLAGDRYTSANSSSFAPPEGSNGLQPSAWVCLRWVGCPTGMRARSHSFQPPRGSLSAAQARRCLTTTIFKQLFKFDGVRSQLSR